MKALVTADLHWSEKPRDQYRHDWVKQFRQLIRKYDVDCVLLLGDLTEQKHGHSAELVNKVVAHIHSIAKLCPVVILEGNHDGVTPNHPFFRFAERIEGVTWVNTPSEGKNLCKPIISGLNRTLFLPFTSNFKQDWADLDFSRYDWIFAHQTFQGAEVGYGRRLDGIPLSVFPKSARVISGDIHSPQKLGCVTYVGAPYRVDFGDDYEPRVLLIDGEKLYSIPCTGPQKCLVEVNGVEDFKRQNVNFNSDDIYKIRIKVKHQEKWPEMKAAVYEWAEKNRINVFQVLPLVEQRQSIAKRKTHTAKSDRELLEGYAKIRKISESVLKTGINLMQKT